MRVIVVVAVAVVLAGCSKSHDEKMMAVCKSLVMNMAADPSGVIVNSSSIVSAPPAERNLRRFAEINSREGKLSVDQEAALEVDIKNIDQLREAYASVDYTVRSASAATRDKAICWYMNRGRGFELASVSAFGRSLSGFSLFSFFVENERPEYLSGSGAID